MMKDVHRGRREWKSNYLKLKDRIARCSVLLLAVSSLATGICRSGSTVCSICKCSLADKKVNCSGLGLTEIPQPLPVGMVLLNLKENNITRVDKSDFAGCLRLYFLDLSSNRIESLSHGIFEHIQTSLQLHLHDNRLRLKENIFPTGKKGLRTLYIHENVDVSHKAFDGLSYLQELHVDANLTGGFGSGFSTLKGLKTLRIYGTMDRITNKTFGHLGKITTLKKLVMRRVGLTYLESGAFGPLSRLEYVDLSYNYRLNLTTVSRFLNSLSDQIKRLYLTAIRDDYNPTVQLDEDFFQKLARKKKLGHLKLDKNDLLQISSKLAVYAPGLLHLDISSNRLDCISSMHFYIILLVKLAYMKCNEQLRRPRIPEESRPRRKETLSQSPRSLYSIGECKAKELRPCKFKRILTDPWCFLSPRKLVHLEMSDSNIEDRSDFPNMYVIGRSSIETFTYGRNGIKWATGPLMILNPNSSIPMTLDFSYNGMVCLAPDFLSFSIGRGLNIGNLNLEGNDLDDQLQSDEVGATFAAYTNLVVLNLSNNKLKSLSALTFCGLANLNTLNLSLNFLQVLAFDVSCMKKLKVLDLSENLFVTFEHKVMSSLTSLSLEIDHANLTVYITNNPLVCSCDSLDFMYWIRDRSIIANLDQVTCLHESVEYRLSDTKWILYNLEMFCYYALPLKISGGLVALLIVCIMIGTIAYKYRWDIRYYLIKHSQRKKIYQLLVDQNTKYQYDAFVSYDMNDRKWIIRELIPNVEKSAESDSSLSSSATLRRPAERGGTDGRAPGSACSDYGTFGHDSGGAEASHDDSITYRLCIHERDFELGNEIDSNIMSAIQSSRMVLLVVTNHFVKSNWCRMELEMAKMESLERGRNIVVTIILEPIEETLDSLEWLMKRYTYLEWYKCDTWKKRDEFWKKTKIALGSKVDEKIVCECGRPMFN